MIIKRKITGNLVKDDSPYDIKGGDYLDAYDISTSEVAGSVKTMRGNRLVGHALPAGTNKTVGKFEDVRRNRIIYFVRNSNNRHCVIEYSNATKTTKRIFTNLTDSGGVDILSMTGLILSVNVVHKEFNSDDRAEVVLSYWRRNPGTSIAELTQNMMGLTGDELYFLDGDGRPTYMCIDKMKHGIYTPVTRDIIDVAKDFPDSLIVPAYANDADKRVNNLRNRLFKFKYQWIFDENETSVWSAHSKVAYPANSLDDDYAGVPTNNNVINLSIPTGGKQVKKINLAMSYSEGGVWSDFVLVDTIEKTGSFGADDNTVKPYSFYNDSSYPPIDVRESIHICDAVPLKAEAQELVNGNTLIYGNITEGLNRVALNAEATVGLRDAGSSGISGSLTANSSIDFDAGFHRQYRVLFSGSPIAGTKITVRLKLGESGAAFDFASYTTVPGDTLANIAQMIAYAMFDVGDNTTVEEKRDGNAVTFQTTSYRLDEIRIVAPGASITGKNSLATWLYNTRRKLGIVYFDDKGRNYGVHTVDKLGVAFPQYSETFDFVQIPYINAKIFSRPPIWAKSYSWVITKELTSPVYLYWCTSEVKDDDEYLYFNVEGIALNAEKNNSTADVISYSFAKGDRMRLIKEIANGMIFDDALDAEIVGYVTKPKINSAEVEGTFVKIRKSGLFASRNYSSNNFIIQLYSPVQSAPTATEVYYEFGQNYSILNPFTAQRSHQGMIASQDANLSIPAAFEFLEGDAYFRARTAYISDSGIATFYAMDANYTDTYKSNVSSIGGRPFIVDAEARQRKLDTLVRHSDAYQQGTNINNIHRFYPDNSDEYPLDAGPIRRIKARDGHLRVFQKHKVGRVPVYAQIIKDVNGNDTLAVSDRLINRIQYYQGDFGIGDVPESLASNNFADYFVYSDRGAICRLSMDGITPISITEKFNDFAVKNLTLSDPDCHVFGAFDAALNRYVITIEKNGYPLETLFFSERKKGFETFSYCRPEMWACLGTLLMSFKDGSLWTHDGDKYANYFGVQYRPSITISFNDGPEIKKGYKALSMVASQLWDCPKIETNNNQSSLLSIDDFKKMKGAYHASFLRDQNSPKGLLRGDRLTGHYILVTLSPVDGSKETELAEVDATFLVSNLNNR